MTLANVMALLLATPLGPVAVLACLSPLLLVARARTRQRSAAVCDADGCEDGWVYPTPDHADRFACNGCRPPADNPDAPVFEPRSWPENECPSHTQWVDWFLACNRPAQEALAALAHADANVANACFQSNHNRRIRELTARLAAASETLADHERDMLEHKCGGVARTVYEAKVRALAIETRVTHKAAEWAREDPSRVGLLDLIAQAHAEAQANAPAPGVLATAPTDAPSAPTLHPTGINPATYDDLRAAFQSFRRAAERA